MPPVQRNHRKCTPLQEGIRFLLLLNTQEGQTRGTMSNFKYVQPEPYSANIEVQDANSQTDHVTN